MSAVAWAGLFKPVRKAWGYMKNPLVPWWVKLIPILVILYVISPLDFLPDAVLGLGQLDDIGIILIGLKLFFMLIPKPVVDQGNEKAPGKKGVHPADAEPVIEEGEFEEI